MRRIAPYALGPTLALTMALGIMPGSPFAQENTPEDDRDFLTAFLEDSLSGAGRQVTITGFSGALSARAVIDRLTIADDAGVWLTVSGVTLDWRQSALLSGAIEIGELSAESIVLERLPASEGSTLPAPEAGTFSLPDLPVSINVGRLAANTIILGEPVLGQPVTGSLDAGLQLSGGEGLARLTLLRTDDGPEGRVDLDASFSNATRALAIDLQAAEGPGGIVARLLDLPDAPTASLSVVGAGPVDAFVADIRLATDGVDRLAGTVSVTGAEDGTTRLQAEVAGNLAPLLVPDMVDFFGSEIGLTLDARRSPLGALQLDTITLRARSLSLTGQGRLAPDGLPEQLALTGVLASPDGRPVALPFADIPTQIARASFTLSLTEEAGAGWSASAALEGLVRDDLAVDALELSGSGRIGRTPAGNSLGGTLRLAANGLAPADPGLAAALGPALSGGLRFHHLQGSGVFTLSDLRLQAEGFAAQGRLRIEGLQTGLLTSGRAELRADDLARFSGLAGRPLSGRGTVLVEGSASRLSGFLDGTARLEGQGLQIGIAAVDPLLTADSVLSVSVLRDASGTRLRALDLRAGPLAVTASGTVASAGSNLTGRITLRDLAVLGPGFGGSASLETSFAGTPTDGRIRLDGTGSNLRVGTAEIDRLLAGTSTLATDLTLTAAGLRLTEGRLTNPQLTATASGEANGALRRLALDARLANLGLLIPDLQGPLTLTGSLTEDGSGYAVDLSGRGPGQVDGKIAGRIAPDFASADVSIAGTGQAALANIFLTPRAIDGPVRYDLRLAGPLRLSSLSGRVTLANGRFSDPSLGYAVEGIEALADLQGGQARLSTTARLSTGGRLRIDGPVALSAPYGAQLTVALNGIRLLDPELFETFVDGSIAINGPLTGGATISGALVLSEAELRVPDSGFATAGALLDLTHVNEPDEVRATRARAGLLEGGRGNGSDATSAPFRLDLLLSAPSRIFIRGRGIDAELGGQVRLLGTSSAVVPSGGFSLIRGRLDILGKRLVLDQADLALEGSFVPVLQIAANSENDGVVSTVRLEGRADDPVVSFSSTPDLPQEEVLAQLLFGRGLDKISALQAAQLANAVAVLAGRGGTGLVNRLRQGFGLDDLDVATSDDGTTALTAGKYLAENVYTEIEIEQGGKTSVTLNLDLRPGVTARAAVDGDGETGIGIFIERDY